MSPTSSMPELEAMDFTRLQAALDATRTFDELKTVLVEAPFQQPLAAASYFLGFIVLMIANPETGMIDRVTITDTELAKNTFTVTSIPFHDIKIPLHHPDNIAAQSIDDGKPRDTTDWYYTFTPALSGDQARINQASAGIAYTAVYPLKFSPGGVLSFSYYQYASEIGDVQRAFMTEYSRLAGEAINRFTN